MKILVLNNYSFSEVWEEIKLGKKPANHLYGIDYLDKMGMEIVIVPNNKNPFFVKLSKFLKTYFPIPFGDLDQQISALKMIKGCDLIYSPCQTQTWLLSYLRALGFLKIPIVAVAHHPFSKGRLHWLRKPFLKLSFKGIDSYPALSKEVAKEINHISGKLMSSSLFWGPDLDYFKSSSIVGDKVLLAGRTGRDFITFGKALTLLPHIKAKIICLSYDYNTEFEKFGKNIEVIVHNQPVDYNQMFEEYENARIIAIPYHYSKNICGLTSLNDALSMRKPVIMTKSEFIDIDIEQKGFGWWIDSGDIEGWKTVIEQNWLQIETLKQMGEKGREYAEKECSHEIFNKKIYDIICGNLPSSKTKKV